MMRALFLLHERDPSSGAFFRKTSGFLKILDQICCVHNNVSWQRQHFLDLLRGRLSPSREPMRGSFYDTLGSNVFALLGLCMA